jgi:hypothetical protein
LASTSGGRFLRWLRKITTLQILSSGISPSQAPIPAERMPWLMTHPEHLLITLVRRLQIELRDARIERSHSQ